jgi:hypothetical protein
MALLIKKGGRRGRERKSWRVEMIGRTQFQGEACEGAGAKMKRHAKPRTLKIDGA